MDVTGADAHSWWIWLLVGMAFWMMFAGKNSWGCSPRRSRRRRRSAQNEEIEQLKKELEASSKQIETLKARLNAVETIVTDEEHELRREFRKLQEQ